MKSKRNKLQIRNCSITKIRKILINISRKFKNFLYFFFYLRIIGKYIEIFNFSEL